MTKEVAPFSPEQVRSMNEYHPFTCGGNRTDEAHRAYQAEHGGDFGELVATEAGWRCPVCGYTQDWAHGFMANWEWKR